MILYDDYIWRLTTAAPQPVFSIDLPKDLQWEDELTWNKVDQSTEFSLTGALLIQEGVRQKGRYITLIGKDDMAWITREVGVSLLAMANSPGLVITCSFLHPGTNTVLHSFNTMFRHFEKPAVDIKRILHWDQFEPGAWYIVNSIKLMETLAFGV